MTFSLGDRVTVHQGYDSVWEDSTGVVIAVSVEGYSRDVTEIRFDTPVEGSVTNRFFTNQLVLIAPAKRNKNEARTLRGKIQKRIDEYKSIDHPTLAVKTVIEELEGVLSL